MKSVYVAPEDELTIGKVAEDLQQHLGKTEREVLGILSGLVEDSEWGKNRIQVYVKAVRKTRSWSNSENKEVDAVLRPRVDVHPAALATRLRKVARDGWLAAAVPIKNFIVGRVELIEALEARRWSAPLAWTGARGEKLETELMTRAAIKKTFPALRHDQWRNLFDRDASIAKCRAIEKDGRKVLYLRRMIEQWLVRNGHYSKGNLQQLRVPGNNSTARRRYWWYRP